MKPYTYVNISFRKLQHLWCRVTFIKAEWVTRFLGFTANLSINYWCRVIFMEDHIKERPFRSLFRSILLSGLIAMCSSMKITLLYFYCGYLAEMLQILLWLKLDTGLHLKIPPLTVYQKGFEPIHPVSVFTISNVCCNELGKFKVNPFPPENILKKIRDKPFP